MPNCFRLIRAGEAVLLQQVDEEMCRHFGEPCHPKLWFRSWYDCIGFDLAMGRSFAEVKEIYAGPAWVDSGLLPVAEWLEANFTVEAWYEMSSRPRPEPDRTA